MAVKGFFRKYRSNRWAAKLHILLFCLSLSTPLFSAGLGQIRVHSALGERLDASIPVIASDSESLTSDCFQLTAPHEDGDVRTLRRARFEYRRAASGGELHIQGLEIEQEPLLKMALQLRCPQDDARGVAREYSVLLDPREYKAAAIAPVVERVVSVVSPSQAVAPVVQEKPARRMRVAPTLVPLTQSTTLSQTAAGTRTTKSLRTKLKAAPERAEFRLQLSTAALDPVRTDLNLTEEDKLKLRERLLLIDADDQTAQLLQLKDRITRLEKQLSILSAVAASSPTPAGLPVAKSRIVPAIKPVNEASFSRWLWAGFAVLLLLPLGFMLWRWRVRNQAEQNLFTFDTDFNGPDTVIQPVDVPVAEMRGVQSPNTVARINDGWGSGDNMDVVSPVNVAEEAQLLLDHGLLRQAIELLLQEVGLRPTALALWMKLFEAYRTAGDSKNFQVQAIAFQEHFVSDALWRQVQAIGRDMEPLNPLYIVHEAQSLDELAVPVNHVPSGNDDFDILTMIQRAEQQVPVAESPPKTREVDLPLEFHLPEMILPPVSDEGGDAPVPAPFIQEDDHLFGFDAPSLELPALQVPADRKPLSPENFTSSDAVLQTISYMIFGDQREEACQQLEELLYKGTFEQRLVAAKWLDQLTPVRSD